MIFKKCCFFIPLHIGCSIIGAIFLSFHVGELITHTNDTIFIKNVSHNSPWGPVVMAPILMGGTLVSVLLIYGAAKVRYA